MNTFALEIFDDQGQVCTFYTVRWEDTTLSETDKFFQKFRYDEQLKNSLRELASFLEEVIGDEHGALEYFFRFENAAQALLDTAMRLNAQLTESGDIADISNDAYCDLVDMLKTLSTDYDIASMAEDALVD